MAVAVAAATGNPPAGTNVFLFRQRPVFVVALATAGVLALAYSALSFGLPLLVGAGMRSSSSGSPPTQDQGDSQVRIEVAGPETGTEKGPPEEDSMALTVPRLARVAEVPVTTAPAQDERALDGGALHVEGTGFPWERNSNVYIAGHRLGYPGTGSNLLFYDLPKLREGDLVRLTDAGSRDYRYRVYRRLVVEPDETAVTHQVPGKRIVSLQTCTFPDYSQRIVVQAELVGESSSASAASS